jgi:branched-chain amino acid transport system substrate-binding protein
MDAQGGPMAKQMKELGIKAKFLRRRRRAARRSSQAGRRRERGPLLLAAGHAAREDGQGSGRRSRKVHKKFNAEIQLYAPYVYDAVMVMAEAMKRAGSSTPAKFLPEVGKTINTTA